MLRRFDQALPRLSLQNRHRAEAILAIAIPAGLNSLLDILSIAIDLLMVGMISTEATVAVGVGLNYFMLIYVVTTVFFVGTNAMVSRFFGARDFKAANEAFSSMALAALAVGVPLFGAAFFSYEGFFDLIGTSSEAKRLGLEYLSILIFVAPVFVLKTVMVSALSASGDTKTPFVIKLLSSLLNALLNYLLIFGKAGFPEFGVSGAAFSTLAVNIMEFLILTYLFWRGKKSVAWSGKVSLDYIKRGVKVGLPSGVERCLTIVSILVITKLVASYGTPELAGYQIAVRIEGFAFMPGFGFMVAAMTLVGQNLGAKNPSEAEACVRVTLWLGGIFMGILGLWMILIPEVLTGFFSQDAKTITLGALYLWMIGFSQIPLAMVFILDGALRGAGATKVTLWVNTLSIWGIRIVPAIFIASRGCPLGWIYALLSLETFWRAWIFWTLFKRGIWKGVNI